MMQNFDFEAWARKIERLRCPKTRAESLQFHGLVEEAAGSDDIRVARMLMSLLTRENEIGMLQVVVRILGSIDIRIYYQCYLEALPRLVENGAGWDIGMIGYPERNPTPAELIAISEIAKHAPREIQALFRKTLERDDCDLYWAEELLDLIAPDEREKAR